jgi:hypothetical protein
MFELARSFARWLKGTCKGRQGGRASYLELNRFESTIQSLRLDFFASTGRQLFAYENGERRFKINDFLRKNDVH